MLQTVIYGTITYFTINFERTAGMSGSSICNMGFLSKVKLASYNLCNLNAAGKFFLYLLFMFLTFTNFTFYGMMAVGLTSNQQTAAVLSSAFYSLWNLLSGFLVPKPVTTIYIFMTTAL